MTLPNPPACPHCGAALTPPQIKTLWGQLWAGSRSPQKAAAARANGRKGGRPRKRTAAEDTSLAGLPLDA